MRVATRWGRVANSGTAPCGQALGQTKIPAVLARQAERKLVTDGARMPPWQGITAWRARRTPWVALHGGNKKRYKNIFRIGRFVF